MRRVALFVAVLLVFPLAVAQGPPSVVAPSKVPAFAKEDPEFVKMLEKARDEVKGQNIYDCIQSITTDPIGLYRLMGSPTQGQFIEKYKNVFTSVSPRIKSQVVHFSQGGAGVGVSLPTGGNNILGVLPGKDLTKWVVIGGHYDTREATIGGAAIDNTSGICTVKEFARVITALNLEPEATVVFAWWDGEEWGLFGARAFVRDHNATKLLLGLKETDKVEILMGNSHDIVGINYPAYNTWVTWGQPADPFEFAVLNLRTPPTDRENLTLCPSYGCYRQLAERDDWETHVQPRFARFHHLVREIAYAFLELPEQHVQVRDDKYGRSDHVPFTAAGIPGMRVQGSHDNQWPHYHQPTDTLVSAAVMAGGIDRLLTGFTTQGRVGGLTAIYIAMKGDYGQYAPDDAYEVAQPRSGQNVPVVKEKSEADSGIPAPTFLVVVAAALFVALARRLR